MLCSCGQNTNDAGANAIVHVENDEFLDLCIYNTDTLNPLKTSARHNAEVLSLLYDSLFSVTQNFEAIPDICESYTVSQNGLVYSFKIRKNVKFQNGKELTPKDVSKSINTIISSDGYYKKRLYMIKDYAFSNTHVRISLNRPVENFCALLDFPILYNGGEMSDEKNILSSIPSGSGIYSVTDYSVNKKITLSVNKNHHSGHMPYIEKININIVPDRKTIISMLEAGQIDMICGYAVGLDSYTPAKSLSYKEYNDTNLVFVGINTDDKVTYSSDFRAYLKSLLSKIDFSDIPYAEDAENLVVKSKIDSEKTSFELLVNKDNPKKVYLAEKIKSSLINSNINIKIRAFGFEKYKEKIKSSDYGLFLGETMLLPNFDTEDLKHIVPFSESSDIPIANLYFKNGVLLYQNFLEVFEIQTLNPYKNIIYCQYHN